MPRWWSSPAPSTQIGSSFDAVSSWAWWPGHSNARYGGSTWFADHHFDELRTRGVAYVNIDGMGQMGARRFGATASAAVGGLAADVVAQRTGDAVEPVRPGRNSDQSFNGVGLPLLQLDHRRLEEDGGYWWCTPRTIRSTRSTSTS